MKEVITKHTEQALAADDNASLANFPFQLIVAADEEDNVKIVVRWPEEARPSTKVRTLAHMLHHVSEGHWKEPMINAVKKNGADTKEPEISGQILQQWGQAHQEVIGSTVCMPPRRVFLTKQG